MANTIVAVRVVGCLAACAMLVPVAVEAQTGTVVHISYVSVETTSDGVETQYSVGDHYIAADGRHRHDETLANGRRVSLFRFPAEDLAVSVNHDHNLAVPSSYTQLPWNASLGAPPLFGGGMAAGTPATQVLLGERAHGPLLLVGYQYTQPGFGTTEVWIYQQPVPSGLGPVPIIPIVVEMTIDVEDGQRFESRATAVRRVAEEPNIFVVPYELIP